ncbi:ELMO domain-containing protein A [Selaginella moellendorffii]|nr:ELMO domain-containing protein A [Selaginella moellendorffii]|eukprot:XP_002971167.2 ELMO domain-containing protein A [Selaginella moellendorffii]
MSSSSAASTSSRNLVLGSVAVADCDWCGCCSPLCARIMSSAARLRRRVHHSDVGGKKFERVLSSGSDGLSEPLLGGGDDEYFEDWKEKKRREEHEWSQIFTRLLAQWSQWLSIVLLGSGSLLGDMINRVLYRRDEGIVHIDLTPVQEERLHKLQKRLQVAFDGSNSKHAEALVALWHEAFPGRLFDGLITEKWKEMGWQGTDPSTDFRGGGFISLENLLFLAQRYPRSFSKLLHKEEGQRSEWEYPFAVAGINVSFMLIQMLDLRSEKPSSLSGLKFAKILAEDEQAFDVLYCVAFEMMDAQWLAMRASYMEFNAVLSATRSQLERELSLDDVYRVQDLPAYTLLCR